LNNNVVMPASDSGQFYCPGGAATDASNHLAVGMQADNNSTFQPVGLPQLATYTADSSGNLTTTSTYSNMASVAVGIDSMAISPSGRILAVGGDAGVQLFHFNGSNPITHYTGSLTTEQITQLAWDKNNHLYALSPAGKLFVFTVTTTSVNEAPGSPYSITNPQSIAVLPE
jgi:WD40 repeat protein